ncbi:hypothetical protein CUMW_282200 [Citrus unshiu]|uniref:ER lumen protein-retaining receptor n=1 Tax=Citrus unshiu TaxID=55188 RepID=A0A2H5N0M0_CITUN|nr:hypothetical protein CUMW_282200 [Citrus unshiu]
MNIFRLAGDMTHLASVLVLLLKIHTIKSCSGVSLKTQELYALVFATRYLDIFTDFVSLAYRGLYILNWVYRYFTEPHYVHWIPWISGLVQTLLYADFFYYYFDSWKNNKNLRLPA